MNEFLVIGLIFLISYTISLFFNFDFNSEKEIKKERPKDLTKYTQNKLVEEYLFWMLNGEYLPFKDYSTIFPYTYANFKPITKLEWEEIFLIIKKELNHLI